MARKRGHSTGGDIFNSSRIPQLSPRELGQQTKTIPVPRHEGPKLEPEIAARVLRTVLADFQKRKAEPSMVEVANADALDMDVEEYLAGQTLDVIDALGLQIPGYVTVVEPAVGVTHVLRDTWDAWRLAVYRAKNREKIRGRIDRGDDPATLEEMAELSKTAIRDRALLREGVQEWIKQFQEDEDDE